MLEDQGILYIEMPSIRTAGKRKKNGSYHFHDDSTHCKFIDLIKYGNIALEKKCKIISMGPVSTPLKNILSIPRALLGIITGKGWGPYLLHMQGKIDHMLIKKIN
jgi:hypothetical protein